MSCTVFLFLWNWIAIVLSMRVLSFLPFFNAGDTSLYTTCIVYTISVYHRFHLLLLLNLVGKNTRVEFMKYSQSYGCHFVNGFVCKYTSFVLRLKNFGIMYEGPRHLEILTGTAPGQSVTGSL